MKREKFKVVFNGRSVYLTKWNSAVRETEKLIKAIADAERTTYRLSDSLSEKDGSYHVKGYRVWQGDNGNTVRFDIEKIDNF